MKIKKISLPDEIAGSIKTSIKNGEWKSGTKLPSEKELSDMYGVNRLTVRLALQKLNTQRILETRVGDGTYVKNFDFGTYINEVSDFYLTQEMIDNVCEFRKSLEVECARLAIERATSTEIEILGNICDQYDEVCSRLFSKTEMDPDTLEELIDKDLAFHREIVRLSKNTLYIYSFEVAREPIDHYLHIITTIRLDNTSHRRDLFKRACKQHRIIFTSIYNKDFDTCKTAILNMIDYTADI